MKDEYEVIVIGGGASGLMCASIVAGRGRSVAVLEHGAKPARKVSASGGGRCNFTNLGAGPDRYICGNPHFVRSALSRFGPPEALKYLVKHRIAYEKRDEGMIFLRGSAAELSRELESDCKSAGVNLLRSTRVDSASFKEEEGFSVKTSAGVFGSHKLVVATGGKSWESLGSTASGYHIARQMGHSVTELRPGLVPLVLKGEHPFKGLDGVSFRARVSCGKVSFEGDVLVTHKGLSGPAILQISSYWQEGMPITLDLMPGVDALEWLLRQRPGRAELKNLLARPLPRRLAHALASFYGWRARAGEMSEAELKKAALSIGSLELRPSGTEGFKRAEVTVGGVDTHEVSSKTMESDIVPGLYIIGEVLDVTGWLGGYNLQWAWSSAMAAAEGL